MPTNGDVLDWIIWPELATTAIATFVGVAAATMTAAAIAGGRRRLARLTYVEREIVATLFRDLARPYDPHDTGPPSTFGILRVTRSEDAVRVNVRVGGDNTGELCHDVYRGACMLRAKGLLEPAGPSDEALETYRLSAAGIRQAERMLRVKRPGASSWW